MLSWLGVNQSDTATDPDGEEEGRHLIAHKLLMKTLSQQSLSQTPKVDGVWCYDSRRKATTSGTLCLTGHNMILYADDTTRGEVWVAYKNIDAVERRIGMDKGTLVVKCKDLRQFNITIPGVDEASNVAYTVETLSNVMEPRLQFPYFYRTKLEFSEDGWDLFKIDERNTEMNQSNEKRWRISQVNVNFGCCRTYGTHLIVPTDIDDDVLKKSAKFRQGGRFPVMSYCHRNNATIIRSSQPLVGPNNRRCKEDERLLTSMLGPAHKGYILDVRSVQTATQAKTKGGGYESEHHYSRWKRMHMNLKSYYVQQESLIKVVDACNDKSGNMDRWLSKLESSDWMEYVKRSLDAGCLVAQCVDREGWSVLVHGSEGFDSTLTVTSLSQVILDSDCRTIRGFLTLIDREWLQGGHPFTERTFHGPYSNFKQRGEGPVFSIFLECVFQLLQQFPLSFEFTSKLLIDLRYHCYSSPFGTFLFNNVQERIRGKLQSKTVSFWTLILSPSAFITYVNPLYRKYNGVIWPSVAPQSLEFWEEYYIPDLAAINPILERVKFLQDQRLELEIMRAQISKITDIHSGGLICEEIKSANDDLPSFQSSNGNPIQEKAKSVLHTDNDSDTVQSLVNTSHSEDSMVPVSDLGSLSCFYVPMNNDMSNDEASSSYTVNSQPDLLDDLLSFVQDSSKDENTQNLPDLDDLALDSAESNSPDVVSLTPS